MLSQVYSLNFGETCCRRNIATWLVWVDYVIGATTWCFPRSWIQIRWSSYCFWSRKKSSLNPLIQDLDFFTNWLGGHQQPLEFGSMLLFAKKTWCNVQAEPWPTLWDTRDPASLWPQNFGSQGTIKPQGLGGLWFVAWTLFQAAFWSSSSKVLVNYQTTEIWWNKVHRNSEPTKELLSQCVFGKPSN